MSSVTRVSEHTFEIGGMGAAVPQPVIEVGAPVVQTVTAPMVVTPALPAPALPAACAKLLTAKQMLAQAKARLRQVTRELADKKALERERDQLQRLIQAATKEIDNVRRLRAAG
jgi:hypothetical protein